MWEDINAWTAAMPEENVEVWQEPGAGDSIEERADSRAVRVGLESREYTSPRKLPSFSRSKVVLGSMVGDRPLDSAVGTMPAWERTESMCSKWC